MPKEPTDDPLYRKIAGLDPVPPVDVTPSKDLDKLLAGEVKPEEVNSLDLRPRRNPKIQEERDRLEQKAAARETKAEHKAAETA